MDCCLREKEKREVYIIYYINYLDLHGMAVLVMAAIIRSGDMVVVAIRKGKQTQVLS
jgi:hypothetical protein